MNETAKQEYRRLCALIGGKPPYGDCQLVALLINKVVVNSQIVTGVVRRNSIDETINEYKDVDHYWVISDGIDIDPLAEDWIETPVIFSRTIDRTVEPSEILDEYKKLIKEFPEPNKLGLFPLRWQVKNELIIEDNIGK